MKAKLDKNPKELIARAAFSGPAFQYSHGLSIYFPWTKPIANKMWDYQYGCYRLSKRTRWKKFLEVYFEKTMRKTRGTEMGTNGNKRKSDFPVSQEVLALIGRIGTHVFAADGRLQKPGPDSPMGKYGPDDPTGGNCDCPTIKNYPPYVDVPLGDDGKLVKAIPMSEDFFAGKPMVDEPLIDLCEK